MSLYRPRTTSDVDERSCTSDVTLPSDDVSHKTSDSDEFGLESKGKNNEYTERCVLFLRLQSIVQIFPSPIKNVWRNSSSFCSFDRSDEWDQAETLMSDYRTILERREHLHSEVASLGHQNMELEKDLESRLKEEVNEQLVFPPRSFRW